VDYEGFERFLAVKRKGSLFVQNGRGGWMGGWECEFDEENTISSGDIDRRPRHQLSITGVSGIFGAQLTFFDNSAKLVVTEGKYG